MTNTGSRLVNLGLKSLYPRSKPYIEGSGRRGSFTEIKRRRSQLLVTGFLSLLWSSSFPDEDSTTSVSKVRRFGEGNFYGDTVSKVSRDTCTRTGGRDWEST